jgi:hypothetical protein
MVEQRPTEKGLDRNSLSLSTETPHETAVPIRTAADTVTVLVIRICSRQYLTL